MVSSSDVIVVRGVRSGVRWRAGDMLFRLDSFNDNDLLLAN